MPVQVAAVSLRLTSFRVRIFGLSLLVVGLTLLIVAAISWTGALACEVDRLDARLCEEAHQRVVRPPQAGGLARPERDAALKLRLQPQRPPSTLRAGLEALT